MKTLRVLLIAIALFLPSLILAQNNDSSSDDVTLKELQAKINKYVVPSGFIQTTYTGDDAGTSSIAVKRAWVSLGGNLYNGNAGAIDYKLQFEVANNVSLLDAFISYAPVKEFAVKAGQFKVPFTYENSEISPTRLELINYALMTQRFTKMSGDDVTGLGNNAGRDIGVNFYGKLIEREGYSLLSYDLMVSNGYKTNTSDNNKSKDITGRLMLTPVKSLIISASAQWGEGSYSVYDDTIGLFFPGMSDYSKMYRYGAGISYVGDRAFARGEFARGRTAGVWAQGAYLIAGVEFVKNWTLAGRFDYFDYDCNTKKTFEMNYTAGLCYAPLSFLDIKLNYTFADRRGGWRDSNAVYVMLTLKY